MRPIDSLQCLLSGVARNMNQRFRLLLGIALLPEVPGRDEGCRVY